MQRGKKRMAKRSKDSVVGYSTTPTDDRKASVNDRFFQLLPTLTASTDGF